MNPHLKSLRQEIADTIATYSHNRPLTQAKRVMAVFNKVASELVDQAFILGQKTDDPEKLHDFKADVGLEAKSKFYPVQYYLQNYGWDREMHIIDSSKLVQRYTIEDGTQIRVTNWFNGSVIKFKGRTYMAYRADSFPWTVNTRIFICELDKNMQPVKDSSWMPALKRTGTFVEDPRLFIINEGRHLCITYADGHTIGVGLVNMEQKTIEDDFLYRKPFNLRMEKNWMFFQPDNDRPLCVYSINPHVVGKSTYNGKEGKLEKTWKTKWSAPHWLWGEFRGSTCPILVDELYYSFFHGHIEFPPEMKNFIHRQYHVGCYVFKPEPPFEVVAVSREPIISGPYIDPHIPHGGNHNFNIFPCGAYIDENHDWHISSGINDYQIGILKINHHDLCGNLIYLNQ